MACQTIYDYLQKSKYLIKTERLDFMKKIFILLSAMILTSVAPLFASYCIHCGKKLPDIANFCSNCGKAVYNANDNQNSCNNNVTTTNTKVVYSDGITTTSTVKTLSTYTPNENTQIIYKNEYYNPVPVTQTVVVRDEPVCDPLLGLMIWGVIHHNHHHRHHRHAAPVSTRHLPPPHHRSSYLSGKRAVFMH